MKRIAVILAVTATTLFAFAVYVYLQIPSAKDIKGCITTTMYQVKLCPGSSTYAPLKKISPYMQKAVVITEDSAFWEHNGFDWNAIEKNARIVWETGEYKRGGSTITQQLAKNMFLYKNKTLLRKGLEAIITYRIENTLSKKEILERYLNVVEFGKDIYGVKAAAKFYFKKTPAELSVADSVFLAMVLPSPVKYSRSFFRKDLTPFARKRMKQIVNSMYRYNRITQTEYDIAMTEIESFFNVNPPPPVVVEEAVPEDSITVEEFEQLPFLEEEEE